MRLARSFDHQDLLPEVLSLAYGREMAGIVIMLATAMNWIGYYSYMIKSGRIVRLSRGEIGHWTSDAYAFDQAVQAAVTLLNSVRPEEAHKGKPPNTQVALQNDSRGSGRAWPTLCGHGGND